MDGSKGLGVPGKTGDGECHRILRNYKDGTCEDLGRSDLRKERKKERNDYCIWLMTGENTY